MALEEFKETEWHLCKLRQDPDWVEESRLAMHPTHGQVRLSAWHSSAAVKAFPCMATTLESANLKSIISAGEETMAQAKEKADRWLKLTVHKAGQ